MVSKRRKNVLSYARAYLWRTLRTYPLLIWCHLLCWLWACHKRRVPAAPFLVHFIFISFYISVSAWHSSESHPHTYNILYTLSLGKSFPESDKMRKYEPMMSSITGVTTWNGFRHFGQLKTTWVLTSRWYKTIINDFKAFGLMLPPFTHPHFAEGAFLFARMIIEHEHKTWKIAFANLNDVEASSYFVRKVSSIITKCHNSL